MATVDSTSRVSPGNSACSTYNPWILWLKLCRQYNRLIEELFYRLGGVVSKYPLVTIFICFLIMGSLASGFAFAKTENRTEKLYIPQNSRSIKDLKNAEGYGFYRPSRQTEVILLNRTGANVLTEQCFRDALLLHEKITNITGYVKLCLSKEQGVEPAVLRQCTTEEPLRIFNYNSSNFRSLLDKLNDPQIPKTVVFDRFLGKISRNSSGRIYAAKAIRLVYYMKGFNVGEAISEETLDWEKAFLDTMKYFDRSHLRGCGEIFYTSGRSIDDSIAESTGSDVKLVMVTFIVMISFACFMLGKYLNPVTGHGLLAMSGVMAVGFGIVAAFGLCMFVDIPFISIVGVLPFLIIGVGIDDMFIIVDELDRTHPDQTIPKRLSMAMSRVGPAITMTTMTDLLAFAVGTTSIFPSIVYFCTYAALAIAFAFLFLITVFVAFMTFDCKRMNAGRRDMVPCLKAPPPGAGIQRWDEPRPQTSNKIMEMWGTLLMKPVVKGLVIIVSICLLAVGIYGTTFINEEFDRRDLAKDGSEFIKFLDTSESYFTENIKVNIILQSGVNYSDPNTQRKIRYLYNIVEDNRFYRPTVVSWLSAFLNNSASNRNHTSSFITSLHTFLHKYPQFRSDVAFSADNSSIVASRLHCFIRQSPSSVTLRDAMTTLREDLLKKSDLPVFASDYTFIFFEQFVSTLPETIRNLALAAAAILVVTSLFLVNPAVVFLVLLSFVSLIFELLGLMHIWGVSLNSISMINLVMAIGFAVDYSAHFAHAFVFSRETNPEVKVIEALKTVGASVFMGGFSTFLGMIVTAFASSEIFRIFFKMFFGIVVLGLLHGLCFLPVWLSIFCRYHVDVGVKEKSFIHNTATASAIDNQASSTMIENRNPVVNRDEMVAGNNPTIISNKIAHDLSASPDGISLVNFQSNARENISEPTSSSELNTNGPIHQEEIDNPASSTISENRNPVVNGDEMVAGNNPTIISNKIAHENIPESESLGEPNRKQPASSSELNTNGQEETNKRFKTFDEDHEKSRFNSVTNIDEPQAHHEYNPQV